MTREHVSLIDDGAARSVGSPPHPNSGLPEFGILDGRSRVYPTSAGEGLGVGVVRLLRRWRDHYLTAPPPSPPLPHKGGGSRPSLWLASAPAPLAESHTSR